MPVLTDEIAERIEARRQAVAEVGARLLAEQHEPRGFGERRNERIVLALVAVPERESPASYWVSTDGDDAKAVAIPKSQVVIVMREAGGLFLLATMKGWLAADRHFAQANIPGLTKSRKWSDDEREAWKRIRAQITIVRRTLDDDRRRAAGLHARNHSRSFALSRSETA